MRLLIAEDDAVLADGLSRALAGAGFETELVGDGAAALAHLSTGSYDAAILDLGLPRMDGLEALRRLRERKVGTPVLVLTARDGVDDRVRGLDSGADDYLAKPFALPELEARLRALLRRAGANAAETFEIGGLRLDMKGRQALLGGQPVALSAREWTLLAFLARRAGRIVAKEDLVDALCGLEDDISLNAVEVYVHRLRTKLSAAVTIRTVRGLGYQLEKT